jgi:hypothetical protein
MLLSGVEFRKLNHPFLFLIKIVVSVVVYGCEVRSLILKEEHKYLQASEPGPCNDILGPWCKASFRAPAKFFVYNFT